MEQPWSVDRLVDRIPADPPCSIVGVVLSGGFNMFQHIKGMVQGMFIFISVLNSVVTVILVLSRESIPIE